MGDIKGFLKVKRQNTGYRPVCERVRDYHDVSAPRSEGQSKEQSSRCMDCGTPFCHWACPVDNYIPEWNDAVFHLHWEKAYKLLAQTNNFPEITGRICPALCEYSCVLGINDDPVTVRENELAVIEYAFKKGFVRSNAPQKRTGRKVAVIGSGPAGLACADQLNKAGHKVTVFEKDDKIGGILRYGIPDFKLEKYILDRRIEILEQEGIEFKTKTKLPEDYGVIKLKRDFDAVCLAMGSRQPRDLKIEGRDLKGIHFAMDYLIQSNRLVAGEKIPSAQLIRAKGRKVVVLGGGDTGADCVGVAHRQGASCVVQIELMPMPPECRNEEMAWPKYPMLLKTTASHQEGGQREWAVLTKRFTGIDGHVQKLSCIKVRHVRDAKGCPVMQELPGTEFEVEADLAILCLGFIHVETGGLPEQLGIDFDARGNIRADDNYMTKAKGIFAAGDVRRGQSLVVWAISEGRQAARSIDKYLTGKNRQPKTQ